MSELENTQNGQPAEQPADLTAAENQTVAATAATAEEEETAPIDKVFGIPRKLFWCIAFGVAGGYILSGLIGLVTGKTPSATTCAIVCAAAFYFLGKKVLFKDEFNSKDEPKN